MERRRQCQSNEQVKIKMMTVQKDSPYLKRTRLPKLIMRGCLLNARFPRKEHEGD